ncbi:DoxX family protein [Marinovum sp. 2_MG-2023]|uniref:DoxX family protein n=1 Tax=Roseobacteraceae TaxID=2854170 RepID=UPI001FD5C9FC|nr:MULTISPECIES: DoxX family protein [Roseobacteraceae]MCJ7874904.1 DoxX family protein [Phaeobacter sp. J2-8]MDO6731353.1 DoxX family protein [Marinovum sp. 2_MG-2023]MDO6780748.1 DoxX family protein [Marinovum sp. 1_MG-2023]
MTALVNLHDMIFDAIERGLSGLLPLLARFVFAAVLLLYFWNSGVTKLGDGLFGFLVPSTGAYAQIFPKAFEAVGYDSSQLGVFHWLVVVAGTWAEFILPLMIVLGLATRLAALGMIGFIAVQSLTDLYGHGGIEHAATLGAWFDRMPDGVILDQRAFWVFLLVVLVVKGAGALSLDRVLSRTVLGRVED